MDDKEPSKVLKIGKNLSEEVREAISEFLKRNLDVFAWVHLDMEGIDSSVMCIPLTLIQAKSRSDRKSGLWMQNVTRP